MPANVSENIVVPNPIGIARPDLTRGIDLFYMGYTDREPVRAQRITNRLASVFVEENSKLQTERAENTSEILAQQLARSEDRLKQLEDQLRAKKQAYMGRLPDQIPANVQMVNGARSQLESISTQLRSEQDHLLLVENQLTQMREGTGLEAMTQTGAAAVNAAQTHIDNLQAELAKDRALGFLDKHPEVIRLQQEIKQAPAVPLTVTNEVVEQLDADEGNRDVPTIAIGDPEPMVLAITAARPLNRSMTCSSGWWDVSWSKAAKSKQWRTMRRFVSSRRAA